LRQDYVLPLASLEKANVDPYCFEKPTGVSTGIISKEDRGTAAYAGLF
jgi:hypothetical protein